MSRLTSPETENGVLGTCLNAIGQKSGWFNRIGMYVAEPADLFADPRNRAIYLEMKKFYDNDTEPTVQQVIDKVNSTSGSLFETVSASEYITRLTMTSGTIYNSRQFDNAVDTLDESRVKRNQVTELEKLLEDVKTSPKDVSSHDISQTLSDIVDSTETIDETQTFSDIVEEVRNRKAPTWSLSTDIKRLDQVLGRRGIEAGTLITIAARPKVGKTVFMNSLIHTVLEKGGRPVVLNLETKDIEFVSKIIARHEIRQHEKEIADYNNGKDEKSKFSWTSIKNYLSNDIDEEAQDVQSLTERKGVNIYYKPFIEEGLEWSAEQDWYVSFSKDMTMPGIEQLIKKEKEKNVENPRIVLFVDYVQLQVTDSSKEREQITDLTRFYKKLAGKYNIAVVILAQINRDGADDPQVEHLKSSGSLEQDSDVVLILSHAKDKDGRIENHIKINGGTTRLGSPDIFNVFVDHGLNLVTTPADGCDIDDPGNAPDLNDYVKGGEGIETKRKRDYQGYQK